MAKNLVIHSPSSSFTIKNRFMCVQKWINAEKLLIAGFNRPSSFTFSFEVIYHFSHTHTQTQLIQLNV